jgi:hypothetical protein
MKYVFLNQENTAVGRIDDDGLMRSSGSTTAWSEYLAWLDEGNTPDPAPESTAPPTPEEKLAASGLTVEELKTLLDLN